MIKKNEMKLGKILLAAGALSFAVACSDGDDCHECHIAFMNAANQEVEAEIGDFCGAELETVESEGYTLAEDVVVGNDTVPAGDYTADEVHCEDHADH